MGTRGLVGHIIRGRKRASYNHYDSYPSGLGVAIVRFIKSLSPEQLEAMMQNLSKVEWYEGMHIALPKDGTNTVVRVDQNSKPSEELQKRYSNAGFENLDVSSQRLDDWYCLLHKLQGAKALPRILDGTLGHLTDETDFEEDELFCEWAYWMDWEKRTLTVSGGCGPATMSFADLTEEWMICCENNQEGDDDEEEQLPRRGQD